MPAGGRAWHPDPMTQREQPWSDDQPKPGRVVLLTRNPIAEAIESIATHGGTRGDA